jgi:hypothetical protein
MNVKEKIESVLRKIVEPKTDFEKTADEVGIQKALSLLSDLEEKKVENTKELPIPRQRRTLL